MPKSRYQVCWKFAHKFTFLVFLVQIYLAIKRNFEILPMNSMTKTWSLRRMGAGQRNPAAFSLQDTVYAINESNDK